MESRLKVATHTFNDKTQRHFKSSKIRNCPDKEGSNKGDYGFLLTPIWTTESEIKTKLFDEDGSLQPMELRFLDIPYIYRHGKQGFEFLYKLQNYEDISLFGLESI